MWLYILESNPTYDWNDAKFGRPLSLIRSGWSYNPAHILACPDFCLYLWLYIHCINRWTSLSWGCSGTAQILTVLLYINHNLVFTLDKRVSHWDDEVHLYIYILHCFCSCQHHSIQIYQWQFVNEILVSDSVDENLGHVL